MKLKFCFPSTLVFLLLLSTALFAQAKHAHYVNFGLPNFPEVRQDGLSQNVHTQPEDRLNQLFSLPEEFSLHLIDVRHSLTAEHHRYQLRLRGIPVLWGIYYFNIDSKTAQLGTSYYPQLPLRVIQDQLLSSTTALEANETLLEEKVVYYPSETGLIKAKQLVVTDASGKHWLRTVGNGRILHQEDLHLYFHGQHRDTTIEAYVFDPDPLSTANVTYGGAYTDRGDSTNAALDAERFLRNIKVKIDSSSGNLLFENDAIVLRDFANPTSGIIGNSPNYLFNRSDQEFEDLMALFHIENQYSHLQTLGFTAYPGYQVPIDPHGSNGMDNSFFNPFVAEPSIEFGEGGVDDAEDADVLVHEYNHALQLSFTGQLPSSTERKTLEEGLADYFCTAYSFSRSPNLRYDVFTWDGHNEFWPGREGTSTKNYQNLTFQGDFYRHTDFLVATFSEIHDAIGRDTTDQLLWEAMFTLNPTTTIVHYAIEVLEADKRLNNGRYYSTIRDIFIQRGILSADFSLESNRSESLARIVNSLAFAKGGSLWIESTRALEISLYSSDGRLLKSWQMDGRTSSELSGAELTSGVYLLRLQAPDGSVQSSLIQRL